MTTLQGVEPCSRLPGAHNDTMIGNVEILHIYKNRQVYFGMFLDVHYHGKLNVKGVYLCVW